MGRASLSLWNANGASVFQRLIEAIALRQKEQASIQASNHNADCQDVASSE